MAKKLYQQICDADGKGEKDRMAPLSQASSPDLNRQIERARISMSKF